jgi:hypothetical protein
MSCEFSIVKAHSSLTGSADDARLAVLRALLSIPQMNSLGSEMVRDTGFEPVTPTVSR